MNTRLDMLDKGGATRLYVRRDGQQFRAEIVGKFWHHWVYASSPNAALLRLYQHPSCAPWSGRIATVKQNYNLGFGPVTDAHLAWGISMATISPTETS